MIFHRYVLVIFITMQRQIKIEPIPFTKAGIEKLKQEQISLQNERPDVLEHLKKARAMGDLKENGYYQATRQKLNYIDGRLRRISFLLKYGVIISVQNRGQVEIGSKIIINDGKSDINYTIVGREESNPSQGSISHVSPLGKALLGKKEGEDVVLHAPIGKVIYRILKIF